MAKAPVPSPGSPKAIRIAFCITELDPGGAERALVELVTRLDRQQFDPIVFCLGPDAPLVHQLEASGVPVVCFDVNRKLDFGVLFRLTKALRRYRPAILQTWLFHANLLGRLAGRMANIPVIVSGIRVAEKRSSWRLRIDRLTERFVQAHVGVSQAVSDFSIKKGGLNRELMHTIPNGVDLNRFAQAHKADLSSYGIPAEAPTVLFVGRLDPQKDPLLLLDAFPEVQSRVDRVHLIYVGEGELEQELRSRISHRSLESQVHLLGWRADVPELLKSADLLVLPSRWEGMPNVVLEAFASGTPVVATCVEGIPELVTDGKTGWILRSRNPNELANRIVETLIDSSRRSEMGRRAQDIVSKEFTWEANCKAYCRLYQNLTQRSHFSTGADFPITKLGKII